MSATIRQLSGELMRLRLLSEGLDMLMERLSSTGVIGGVKPAGLARAAMLGVGLAVRSGDVLFGTRRDLSAGLGRRTPVFRVDPSAPTGRTHPWVTT